LHRAVALEAIYDSAESFPQPKCHPETRTQMLMDLREWALDADPESPIMWLYGPAGAGKSAIMQTLCSDLEAAGRLGASFFFKRGHETRGNAKSLFTTIAYQLALSVPGLRRRISQIVERDPSVSVRSMEFQTRKLIFEPCCSQEIHNPVTVIIDGLGECHGQNIQLEILRILRDSTSEHLIPLRFVVASRPESHIRELLDSPHYFDICRLNVEKSFDDVRQYLRDEFSRIHHEHWTMASVPSPWPSPGLLEDLVWKSSGHFIYPSTIIKFIDDKNYRPTEQLLVAQDWNGSASALDPLDQLYLTILGSVPRRAEVIRILCAIAHFALNAGIIDQLFSLQRGETRLLLRNLHCVLAVPSEDEHAIYSHHASFLDFLVKPSRSHNFYVGGLEYQTDLAGRFLKLYTRWYQTGWNSCLIGSRYVHLIPPTHHI
ncbi:hypothetical protein C8R45DRAFT_842845, partial [Mycena sanguinolenta]